MEPAPMTREELEERQRQRLEKALRQGLITQSEWDTLHSCEMKLEILPLEEDLLTFRIGFHNISDKPINLAFSLESLGSRIHAARLSLDFRDTEGIRVRTNGGVRISDLGSAINYPADSFAEPKNILAQNGWRWFELTGILQEDCLRIEGVSRSLTRGAEYDVQFYYGPMLRSNIVRWIVP